MIKKSLCFIWKCFSCPVAVFTGMILISVIALGGALASELFLGLEPCRLCIYQRWPFVMTIIIGALGLILRQNNNLAKALTGLGSLIFLMNSMIAFYHTGVEQKWWISQIEGCAVPSFDESKGNWIDNLMAAPSVSCDKIPWQDPIIGLSMANYNIALCFGLFTCCMIAMIRIRRTQIVA